MTVVIPTLNADVNVQVNLIAVERTYIRVIADGEIEFEGRVVPGTAYPFDAVDQVEVLVGNGAAIRIVYNGRDLGSAWVIRTGGQQYLPALMRLSHQLACRRQLEQLPSHRPGRQCHLPRSRFTATPVPSNTAAP